MCNSIVLPKQYRSVQACHCSQAARQGLASAQQACAALRAQLEDKSEEALQRLPSGPGSLASGTDFWLGGQAVSYTSL